MSLFVEYVTDMKKIYQMRGSTIPEHSFLLFLSLNKGKTHIIIISNSHSQRQNKCRKVMLAVAKLQQQHCCRNPTQLQPQQFSNIQASSARCTATSMLIHKTRMMIVVNIVLAKHKNDTFVTESILVVRVQSTDYCLIIVLWSWCRSAVLRF